MNTSSKLIPGSLLQNRYRIESVLGQGGFGAVYQAYDLRLNKMVALKETVPQDPTFLRQFEREAQLLARLQHPALPAVTDYFTEPSASYLVMSYIPGEDLSVWLERQPDHRVSEADALAIITPVLEALEYLHTQKPPIIHRDIKPDNVRIDPESAVYLVDFGLAKAYTPSLKTTIGARALTPGFAPIEQYGAGTTDPRTDLYAVGAMLYVMLSGVNDLPEAPDRLVSDTLVPLRQVNPVISPEMEQVVMRLLAIQPDGRYPNVAAVRQALMGVPLTPTNLSPNSGAPSSPLPQTGPTVALPQPLTRALPHQQNFWAVAGVVGGLMLIAWLMTIMVAALINSREDTTISRSVTVPATPVGKQFVAGWAHTTATPFMTPTPHPDIPVWVSPTPVSTETPMLALDIAELEGEIVFQSEHDGNWDIYTTHPDSSDIERLTDHPADDMHPALSPDGTEIVFQSNRDGNSELYRMPMDGGEPQRLTRDSASDESPTWSPDGRRIAFVSDRDGDGPQLYVMDADDLDVEQLTSSQQVRDATMPAWSPDGKYIAFVQTNFQGGSDIYRLEVDQGLLTNITSNPSHIDTAPAWSPDGERILFQSNRDGDFEIFVKDIEGIFTNPTQITNEKADDTMPRWSADGNYIIFQSNRDGSRHPYVMRADGTQQTQLTNVNTNDESSDRWK